MCKENEHGVLVHVEVLVLRGNYLALIRLYCHVQSYFTPNQNKEKQHIGLNLIHHEPYPNLRNNSPGTREKEL